MRLGYKCLKTTHTLVYFDTVLEIFLVFTSRGNILTSVPPCITLQLTPEYKFLILRH
jgi:hypothetical protein